MIDDQSLEGLNRYRTGANLIKLLVLCLGDLQHELAVDIRQLNKHLQVL